MRKNRIMIAIEVVLYGCITLFAILAFQRIEQFVPGKSGISENSGEDLGWLNLHTGIYIKRCRGQSLNKFVVGFAYLLDVLGPVGIHKSLIVVEADLHHEVQHLRLEMEGKRFPAEISQN